jgi:tRNA G37 N-methylase Trm5
MMHIFIARAASKNFTFISWHKYKNVLVILCDLYIENRIRKKEFTVIAEKKRRSTILREAGGCEYENAMLRIIIGSTAILNVMAAFTSTGTLIIKGRPP